MEGWISAYSPPSFHIFVFFSTLNGLCQDHGGRNMEDPSERWDAVVMASSTLCLPVGQCGLCGVVQ